ncbi:MAG: hypothetical protein ABSF89_09365 [Acidimicrobiales bacterium]|jgi:vacuolar-type H+-ATPase subunit F/Vma7
MDITIGHLNMGVFTDEHGVKFTGELARLKLEESYRKRGYVPAAPWSGDEVRLVLDPAVQAEEAQKAAAAKRLKNAEEAYSLMGVTNDPRYRLTERPTAENIEGWAPAVIPLPTEEELQEREEWNRRFVGRDRDGAER